LYHDYKYNDLDFSKESTAIIFKYLDGTLTLGHWASLSAATIWTFKCLVWDLPLVFISLVRTWTADEKRKEKGTGRMSGRHMGVKVRWTLGHIGSQEKG